jgi:hypothetical protein
MELWRPALALSDSPLQAPPVSLPYSTCYITVSAMHLNLMILRGGLVDFGER